MPRTVIVHFLLGALVAGCGSGEVRPVEIFAEDMCAHCRMAFSDRRFAAELVTREREVYKFDDIGCLESFREEHPGTPPAALFVRDYPSNSWLPVERATVVRTGVATPMASGLVAFADSLEARAFVAGHPVPTTATEEPTGGCCGKEG